MPVTVRQLNYLYDRKTPFEKGALFDIDLDIHDGEFLGIVGHTGSGKSTLVSHLNALLRVQSGTVLVDDIDVSAKKVDLKALRAKVGMVFQYPEHQLFDETVERDVAFGPKNLKLEADEIARRVENAIRLVGLDYAAIKDRSPFELSGGQMRRVAIAGVLAMQPEILVLDEPTAGLDPRGKRAIMSLIQDLRTATKSIVMISHNMDEVAVNCDRIVVMKDGRIFGEYRPDELFRSAPLLEGLNIDMPAVCRLEGALKSRGMALAETPLDEDALADAIASAKKGAGHA